MKRRGQTGLAGTRPICLGQNFKYVPKDVGIDLENCLKFCWLKICGKVKNTKIDAKG